MDWLTFISNIIKYLAWPIATIITLVVLKRYIIDVLRALGNRLERAKGAGIELTFGKSVDQIEGILPIAETATHDRQRIESISEMSQLHPPYIVSQAWLRLEHAIREAIDPDELARRLGLDYLRFANSKGINNRRRDVSPSIAARTLKPGRALT